MPKKQDVARDNRASGNDPSVYEAGVVKVDFGDEDDDEKETDR